MKRLRWPGRDRRSMVRTVASCRMTLMRLAMGFAVTAFYPHHIHTPCVCQKVSIVDFLAVFPSLPLISGTTEDMSNLYSAPHFSVVNEILCGWEAPCAWFDVITYPPGFRLEAFGYGPEDAPQLQQFLHYVQLQNLDPLDTEQGGQM